MPETTKWDQDARKNSQGCVMRALESAMGVKATKGEWDLRLRQMDALEKWINWKLSVESNRKSVIEAAYWEDIGNVLDLLKQIDAGNTTLAHRLHRYSAVLIHGDTTTMQNILASDAEKKVLAMQPHHIEHIALLLGSKFYMSLSDKNPNVRSFPSTPRRQDFLVFTPRRDIDV